MRECKNFLEPNECDARIEKSLKLMKTILTAQQKRILQDR